VLASHVETGDNQKALRKRNSATAQQRNSAGNSFPSVPPVPASATIFRTPAAFYDGLPAIYHPLPGISEPLPRFTKRCPQLQSFCREITTLCRKITEAYRELHNPCREITRACREFHCLRPDLQEAADKPFTAIDAKERTERRKISQSPFVFFAFLRGQALSQLQTSNS
jgi:hypothetical protein